MGAREKQTWEVWKYHGDQSYNAKRPPLSIVMFVKSSRHVHKYAYLHLSWCVSVWEYWVQVPKMPNLAYHKAQGGPRRWAQLQIYNNMTSTPHPWRLDEGQLTNLFTFNLHECGMNGTNLTWPKRFQASRPQICLTYANQVWVQLQMSTLSNLAYQKASGGTLQAW